MTSESGLKNKRYSYLKCCEMLLEHIQNSTQNKNTLYREKDIIEMLCLFFFYPVLAYVKCFSALGGEMFSSNQDSLDVWSVPLIVSFC